MVLEATNDASLPKAGDSSISGQQRLKMDSSAGIVVGHSPQYLTDEGSRPATAIGTQRVKMTETVSIKLHRTRYGFIAELNTFILLQNTLQSSVRS